VRALVAGVAFLALLSGAYAAPKKAPAATRYDGARLAFPIAAGTQVKDASDVSADYALDLVARPGSPLERVPMRLLLDDKAITDAEVESAAAAVRNARLRNRASWGVKKSAAGASQWQQVGGHRVVRLADAMGSVLGAARQILLCGAFDGHLVCGVASAPSDSEAAAQSFLEDVLAGLSVKR
jgi:hypothetical protein